MSTRSGKRIHSSFGEKTEIADPEVFSRSLRKTKSKRFNENEEEGDNTLVKSKKKKNYVSYPAEDQESIASTNDAINSKDVPVDKSAKKKRNTLEEKNVNVPEADIDVNSNKTVRVTRQTKRFAENIEDQIDGKISQELEKVKSKKKQNKKIKNSRINGNDGNDGNDEEKKTQKAKKKRVRRSNTVEEVTANNILNGSNMSVDSFHSAAGSPIKVHLEHGGDSEAHKYSESKDLNSASDIILDEIPLEKKTKKKRKLSIKTTDFDKDSDISSSASDKKSNIDTPLRVSRDSKKRKSSIKNETIEIEVDTSSTLIEKSNKDIPMKTKVEKKIKKKRKSSIKNATFEKDDVSSITSDQQSNEESLNNFLQNDKRKSSILNDALPVSSAPDDKNLTFDKIKDNELNTTFEKQTKTRKSLRSNTPTAENAASVKLNTTYEKSDQNLKSISLDSTFNKSDTKSNSTFDKTEPKIGSNKSSLVSSDGTIDVTFDKENSRFSVMSDESRTENANIMNTTPVLIESSMDESQMSKKSQDLDTSTEKDDKEILAPSTVTPLKREGTFTKESPDVMDLSKENVQTKRDSTASPGRTPFHTSRSSQRSILNITRSIEKPTCRSSLAELLPRQTKVMFCSPVNNPALVTQQKKTVIKSSMKGSNKSFMFDDRASSPIRPVARKRSYTHDAEDTRAKRKRLADDIQQSVDRLSQPRTSTAKPDSTTPTKKLTPYKSKSDTKRTKLPNFAALHQKQFAKMESLSDCQTRKAKRARQLMTPTGGLTVLERSSPKGITEPAKPKETIKKFETPVPVPTLPTLESLRPGYTRFGFKMNTEFNPFSITTKNENKTSQKLNGLTAKATLPPKTPIVPTLKPPSVSRLPILPSLKGATSRKEAAKQTIMREKSFTSLSDKRDVKRTESRTIIKGVRTNRRFELQMMMRKMD